MAGTGRRLRIPAVVGLLALGILLLIISLVWSIMGFSTVSDILPLFLALGFGYIGYELLTSGEGQADESSEVGSDPIERLQKRYISGELTEAEFEQQLERHLDDGKPIESTDKSGVDSINPSEAEFER